MWVIYFFLVMNVKLYDFYGLCEIMSINREILCYNVVCMVIRRIGENNFLC